MNNPLISLITPTFQRKNLELVQNMLRSVNTQTYQNWEHIVCSDGIYEPQIEELAKQWYDPRRRYIIAKKHHGNFGNRVRQEVMMEHTNGQYLVFLDDDNYIFPDYLEKMLNALLAAKNDEKFVICKLLHFGPVRQDVGVPPLYLRGEPKLCFIDTLQIMMEANAMKEIGWQKLDEYCADGYTYEELGRRHKYVRIEECLAVHT